MKKYTISEFESFLMEHNGCVAILLQNPPESKSKIQVFTQSRFDKTIGKRAFVCRVHRLGWAIDQETCLVSVRTISRITYKSSEIAKYHYHSKTLDT